MPHYNVRSMFRGKNFYALYVGRERSERKELPREDGKNPPATFLPPLSSPRKFSDSFSSSYRPSQTRFPNVTTSFSLPLSSPTLLPKMEKELTFSLPPPPPLPLLFNNSIILEKKGEEEGKKGRKRKSENQIGERWGGGAGGAGGVIYSINVR